MIAAVAITICVLFDTSASTVPSSSFTIKEGAAVLPGSFDVTGAQRDIHLTTGLTYEITCKAGDVPGLSVEQRWYRDGSAVQKRKEGSVVKSGQLLSKTRAIENNSSSCILVIRFRFSHISLLIF